MYKNFNKWLDNEINQLEKIQEFKKANAVYFCLEEIENGYSCDIYGCEEYLPENDDWACPEYLVKGTTIFEIGHKETSEDWEESLEFLRKSLKKYLKAGKFKNILLKKQAVAIGFGDGDLFVDYKNNSNILIYSNNWQ